MDLAHIHDLALVLPADAGRRYRILKDANADSAALVFGLSTRLIEENERRRTASTRLAQIKSRQGVGADHPEIIAQTRIVADADAEIERINSRAAQHNLVAGPRDKLFRNIEAWIRDTAPGHDIVDIELLEPPRMLKNETGEAAIGRIRRRLRELSADETRINSAPFPSATAKAVAANYINELADAATPIVSSLVEHGGPLVIDGHVVEPPIVFASKLAKFDVTTIAGPGVATGPMPDLLGLMAFLFRKEMLAAVSALVDEQAEDKIALTHEQRAEQLATIAADRLHAEQDEAHFLWAEYEAGVIVEPRGDMSPAAFLMVQAIRTDRQPGDDHGAGVVRGKQAFSKAGSVPFEPAVHPSQDVDPGSPPS